ncbi:MAG: VCBS repeat-containing protein [Pirellula sp.]
MAIVDLSSEQETGLGDCGETIKTMTPNSPTRRRKWFRRIALGVAVAFVYVAIWGKLKLDTIERDAAELAEIGTSLNQFLKQFGSAMMLRDIEGLMALHDDSYASPDEGLWDLKLQEDRDGVRVYEWHQINCKSYRKSDVRGQLEQHISNMGNLDEAKFKISTIKERNSDGSVRIEGMLWLRGRTIQNEPLESHSTFQLKLHRQNGEWRIQGKELLHGQSVVGSGRGFTDITQTAGIRFESHHNPMLDEPGWRPERFGIMKYATAGVATADYDNDGWFDIFFCDGSNPCLYRNRGNGTFEDTTARAGLPVGLAGVHVAIFGDFDNDGDRDLFLGRSTGNNFLFRNEANGTFTDVTDQANVSGVWVSTASAADYNNDGKLDLYLGRYLDPRINLPSTNFYTRNGQGNTLLRNDGNLRFTDVTEEAGVREGGLSLGIAWGDYDRDGDQDVYVANDFGRNALFRNEGNGKFSDVSKESRTLDIGYGMSASFEDIDNDGDLDIYKAAVHSGQRWFGNSATLQRYIISSIQEGTILEDYSLYREIFSMIDGDWRSFGERVIRGNSLLLNNGNGTFADATEKCRVNPHGWYWSSAIFDFDNDGIQDVYSVNGWVTGLNKDDL